MLGMNPFAGPPPVYAEFAEQWMRDYVTSNNRASTRYSKSVALRLHLLPAFGALPLQEITTSRIDAFIADRSATGMAPKTLNNILSVLLCSLRVATQWGFLKVLPRVRWRKATVPGYRYLLRKQSDDLLCAAGSGFWWTLILFFLRTGARFSEAAVLRWNNVVLDDEPFVRIWRGGADGVEGATKTGTVRTVPIPPDLAEALRRHPHRSERVFELANGRTMRPDSAQWHFGSIVRRAGLPHTSWKDLRHTYATELTSRGVPLGVVMELLGHSTIQMTQRYAHAAPSAKRAAVNLLSSPDARFSNKMVT